MPNGDRVFINDLYSDNVSFGDIKTKDVVTVPNGKTLYIKKFHCSVPNKSNISVYLIWNYGGEVEEYLVYSSSGAYYDNLTIEKEGDGIKKLTIVLKHNNQSEGTYGIGGQVEGYYE